MQRSLFFMLLLLACPVVSQQKKALTADQIYRNADPKVLTSLPNIVRWLDDSHYLEMKTKEGESRLVAYSVDANTGKETEYKGLEQYKDVVGSDVTVTSPASANAENTRLIYVKDNDLYFLNTEKKEFKRLTRTPAEEKNPTLSPDANSVAFTRDNNLFALDLNSGKEKQYTNDGSEVVYSGWASWVYYEEILGRPSRYRAFWWSPDGKKIIFYRFDDSKVPMFPIYSSEGQHGNLERTRYPKSGDTNPEVRVGIVSVETGTIVWAAFNEKQDQYFGQPFWMPDSRQVLVQWMNRGQDTLLIYSIDLQTGKKNVIYSEHQTSWVDWLEGMEFLKGNKGFIIRTDKDGWMHLYWYDLDGRLTYRITQGKWAVTNIVKVDEENELIYFTAKKEASTKTDFYTVRFNGKELKRLTFGPYTHSVRLSPKGSYFITTYSNGMTPTRIALYVGSGKMVRELGDARTKEFDNYDIARTEMFTIPTTDGYNLPAYWTLPTNFDPNKRYPVLISVYGGPGAGTVSDSWRGLSSQWLAQEGMIQMSVDHRASGHFGKEGVALMHRNLGKWEMSDYIEAVKWLHTRPFIDKANICITGGSYGGYVTCMALTYGADFFTHGLALYSVTGWELYDTHYTERYMDTPAENPEGYKFGSAMTHAGKYKGMLRIVHGTLDDNVHMQNSIQLIDTLQDLNKHFEFMIYPGGRHGWGGPKAVHLRTESMRFYYKYLLEKPFPEEAFAPPAAGERGGRR